MLGGQISENLAAHEMYKMSDLWTKSAKEIMEMSEVDDGRAEWIKNLSVGICVEAVAEKPLP